ncbi:hypothetical protein MMC30_001385 [Trapelia coarctata]|nr:hypothetical protein [Trapelia coarctata]
MAATSSSSNRHTSATAVASPLPSIAPILQDDAVWKNAAASYARNQNLSKEQHLLVQSSGPNDVLRFIEDTEKRQSKRKYAKVVKGVRTCTEVLKLHRKSLELLAQAGIVEDHVDAYKRLLGVLIDIARWLEPVRLEGTTFNDSEIVRRSLVALYVDIIGFWESAIELYTYSKPKQVRSILQTAWVNYDNDYRALQSSMEQSLSNFRAATQAQHHRDSQTVGQRLLTNDEALPTFELGKLLPNFLCLLLGA